MPEIDPPDLRSAHVIVVANEKGGTGKSTLSIHISVRFAKGRLSASPPSISIRASRH